MTTFTDSHGHNPVNAALGRGVPGGIGFVHRDRWAKVVKRDICAYCGRSGGTVDHIVPRSKRKNKHSTWLDFTGACERCNGAKGSTPLLLFMLDPKQQARVRSAERLRQRKKDRTKAALDWMQRAGIEPATPRFSGACSTD